MEQKMEQKNINLSISDGDAFFAHELAIHFNPIQFVFDFKSVTPRTDPRTQSGPVVSLKHNVVMIAPWHAKMVHKMLAEIITKYEKEFGKIEKPKAIELFEKRKKKTESKEVKSVQVPNYFG